MESGSSGSMAQPGMKWIGEASIIRSRTAAGVKLCTGTGWDIRFKCNSTLGVSKLPVSSKLLVHESKHHNMIKSIA